MKESSTSKGSTGLLLFFLLSLIALYYLQTTKIDPNGTNSSGRVSAKSDSAKRAEEAEANRSAEANLHGKLVTTDIKPEANKEVVLSLADFTNHPDAKFYILIDKHRLDFQNGRVKYKFPREGKVSAELRCSFRDKDVRLDLNTYEVANRMTEPGVSLNLEEE